MKSLFLILLTVLSFPSFSQEIEESVGVYNFIPNGGQWPEGVFYRADVNGGKIWLEEKGILYEFFDIPHHHADFSQKHDEKNEVIKKHYIFAEFLGANQNIKTEKKYPTKEYYNYFLGNKSEKWASDLHGYNQITYKKLYDNIDLIFFEKDYQLKYEFKVAKNSNPEQIKVKYHGHDKIKLNKSGNLIIESSLGQITEEKPYAYQIINGKIVEVKCDFVLNNNVISFQLGQYNKDVELIIDPILIFSTYCGSPSDNFGMTATYAYDGKAYSGGIVYGNAYPTPAAAWNTTSNFTGVSSASYGITDVFISKFSEDGQTMLWTTFIGGGNNTQGTETVHSLICDKNDNIYLYGATSSVDFPIVNGFQSTHGGGVPGSNYYYNGVYYTTQGTDIFVAKFSTNGMTLMGSTYIGGSGNDGVNYKISSGTYSAVAAYDSLTTNYGDQFRGEIMVDSLDNIIVASCTRSTDFPTLNSFQLTSGGQQDGVVFKISPDFSNLLWSSYFGGAQNDACYSVKLDSSYNILIAGGTSSNNLPNTMGSIHSTYQGGKTDGFVAKISPDGSSLFRTSYIGTNLYDQVIFVEIDRYDNVYLLGQSLGNMPITLGVYNNPNSGQFIMKLNPNLDNIEFSTEFGNSNGQINISPSAFLVDVCGNLYVSGWGANILQPVPLSGMPISPDAFQSTPPNGFDFYLIVLARDAEDLIYGSYLGGNLANEHVDGGTSRFDSYGVVYQSVCGGCGGHSDFPTTPGAWSANNLSTNCNALLFKFDFEIIPVADFQVDLLEGCSPLTITFTNESNDTINSVWEFDPASTIISGGVNPVVVFTEPGTYEVILYLTDTICNLTDTAKKIITVYNALELEVPNDTILCDGTISSFDLTANSNGTATSFIWSDTPDFSNIINGGGLDSTITITPNVQTTYYVTASNGWPLCDLIDSVTVFFIGGVIDLIPDTTICRDDTITITAQNLSDITLTIDWINDPSIIIENEYQITVSPNTSQYYYITATYNSCTVTDSVWVQVNYIDPSTAFIISTPDSVAQGGTVNLQAFPDSSIYFYQWIPNFSVHQPNSQTTTATINDEDKDFIVFISDGYCTVPATTKVYSLEFVCGDVYIYVPNAFTPNNDNENDILFVRGQNILEMDLKIFDRWGELVFESKDQNIGWDGTFKGIDVDPDVYVYHLKFICVDQQENFMKGNITLIR